MWFDCSSFMGQVLKNIGRLYHKYVTAITFPVVFFGLIYADWSHTQKWKKNLQLKEGLHQWVAKMTDNNAILDKLAKMKSQYTKTPSLRTQYLLCLIPFAFFYLGYRLELIENERMSRYRDKSKLYGIPGNPPSEPSWR